MKSEAHSLVVAVCRKRSLLCLLPLLGACQLLFLALSHSAEPSTHCNTTSSEVTSSLDAINCLATYDTVDEESRQLTDGTNSPYDYFVGPDPSVDRAHRISNYQGMPLHFAATAPSHVQLSPSSLLPVVRHSFSEGGFLLSAASRGPPCHAIALAKADAVSA